MRFKDANIGNVGEKIINSLSSLDEECQKFYFDNISKIEIIFKNDNLLTYYFPLNPVWNHLTEKTKEDFFNHVNRDTTNQKLADTLRKRQEIFDSIEH